MRITSWNVNGLRKFIPLKDLFENLDSDIICIQESRISRESDIDYESLANAHGYNSFFNDCQKRMGYSGVVTFCRRETATPVAVGDSFADDTGGASAPPKKECDLGSPCSCQGVGYSPETLRIASDEGRCLITDHKRFVLINVYVPAVSVDERAGFKMEFLHALHAKIIALHDMNRRVIIVGDFNICPARIDSADRMEALKVNDLQWSWRPPRAWFHHLLRYNNGSFVDVFRQLHPSRSKAYTCWSESTRGRETNHGVRIDLIVMDRDLFESDVSAADIWPHVMGSDHCPVTVEMSHSEYSSVVKPKPSKVSLRNKSGFGKRQILITQFVKSRPAHQGFQKDMGASIKSEKIPESLSKSTVPQSSQKSRHLRPTTSLSNRNAKRPKTATSTIDKSANDFFTSSKSLGATTKLQQPQKLKGHFSIDHASNISEVDKLKSTEKLSTLDETSVQSNTTTELPSSSNQDRNSQLSDAASNRERTKQAWRQLLPGPPPPPLCRHGKPCALMTVSKSGENKNRTFFSCTYPKGARCDFFRWAPFDARYPLLFK